MKKPFCAKNRMKAAVDAREELAIPTYTLGRKQPGKHFKRNLILIAIITFLAIAIYVPPLFINEPAVDNYASVDLTQSSDRAAMESAQIHLRNNPEADFDGDGLTNESELNAGTGVYIIDNDDDGVTDYAELYITKTNPKIKDDALQSFVINADAKNGATVNTPFKVGDVVLWADDYTSKCRGSVLPLQDGSYVFYRFKGWVQFPSGEYAYKVEHGLQSELKRNDNGYFYLDTDELVNVRVYKEKPEACHVLSLFGTQYCLNDDYFGKALSFFLPSSGFGLITCRPALVNDFDGTWAEAVVTKNDPAHYSTDELDVERFGRDDRGLEDLSTIFAAIDDGKNVIISLMSHEVGESLVEIYGYTNRNNLLICDPISGDHLGAIYIRPYSSRLLDASGSIQEYRLFFWSGCGYSSSARHRIMLINTIAAGTAQE